MQLCSPENDTPVNSFVTDDKRVNYFSQSATAS